MAGIAKANRARRNARSRHSGPGCTSRHRPVRRDRICGSVIENGGSPGHARDPAEIERAITAFAHTPNGGRIVTASARAVDHRDLIITLAARHKLPAVYYERFFVDAGGLISYGPNYVDLYRGAAGYVDRILKGEKPSDLP